MEHHRRVPVWGMGPTGPGGGVTVRAAYGTAPTDTYSGDTEDAISGAHSADPDSVNGGPHRRGVLRVGFAFLRRGRF